MDRLLAMSTFARVVELGGFARAAERLSLSTSAVSRQVSELEAHLDTRLLNRTTRRLSLTEAGQAYYERCVQLLADLDETEAALRRANVEPRGRLRLTCGISYGVRRLAPLIAEFGARHPGVEFDLDLSDRAVDLVEEGFDLAIRIGSIGHQALVSRRIGWTRLVCCASPAYLAARGTPRTPADLARHECLEYAYLAGPRSWLFEDAGGQRHETAIRGRVHANNGRMLAALAVEGMGVTLEPDFIVEPELRAGRLVELLPGFSPPRTPIAAVYPSRRHLSAKLRRFVEFVAERSGQ